LTQKRVGLYFGRLFSILGDFFTNSSGRPAQNRKEAASWDDFGGFEDDWGDSANAWKASGKPRTRKEVRLSREALLTRKMIF
jgi:hypothetical protein